MTKVEISFRLREPLDDKLMHRISDAHGVYGILRVRVHPSLDGLTVEYDASRLNPKEVRSALAGQGIPVEAV